MEDNATLQKDLKYYAALPYEILITPSPEGGFVATIPDLPGCITQGDNWDKYNGRLKLRIPRSLHKKLSKCAAQDGVNLNQLAIYLLANGIGEQRDFETVD